MPDLDAMKDEVFALLKNEAKDLWDGEEDTEFLKEVGGDMAGLRFQRLAAATEAEKDALDTEIAIVDETIKQRLQQKLNLLNEKGRSLLPTILGTILKTLVGVR